MQVVRIYTGSDGESHFEDLDLGYQDVANARQSTMRSATGIQFRRTPPGSFNDFHNAPGRQYVITLEGQMELGLGGGTKRVFNPGDVLLTDDLTGRGHTTAVYGNLHRVLVIIPLVD